MSTIILVATTRMWTSGQEGEGKYVSRNKARLKLMLIGKLNWVKRKMNILLNMKASEVLPQ
jgi:hypothetical protein